MATEGGEGRIILVGRTRDARPPAPPVAPPPAAPAPVRMREPERERQPRESRGRPPRPRTESAWTPRRLINGALFSGIATVAGGLVFQQNFQLFGDNNRQLLAAGFGLFVVGMVTLTLCLIGIAARGVHKIVAGQGWAAAVVLGFAPAIPLVLLNSVGVLSYAFPALFVIIVAGGFAVALKQR
jgi:hypothetical protein